MRGETPEPGTTGHDTGQDGTARWATAPWAALAAGLDGTLALPTDPAYPAARPLFSPRFDAVRPAALAYCAHAGDVAACLTFARRHGIPVAVRGGGHSYAGWSTGPGLVVDVQPMAAVEPSGETATIGAGAKLIDVYDRLATAGVSVSAGSCPTVGFAGLALGGGVGVVSRAYGMTCDRVTGVRIVTADGTVREVDAEREPELFWALRGAGHAGFGVATAFRVRTFPVSDCTTFDLSWPWSRADAVLRAWLEWAPSAPDGLWSNLRLRATAGEGAPRVFAGGLSLDPRAETERQLDLLAGLVGAAPTEVEVRTGGHLDGMREMGGVRGWTTAEAHLPGTLPGRDPNGRAARESYEARSHFFARPLPEAGRSALLRRVESLGELPAPGWGGVVFDALGGAVNRVAPDATAFVHRSALALTQYLGHWPEDADPPAVARIRDWLDGTREALHPWSNGHAYQNYTDPGLADWRWAYYGAHAPRLAALRATYDPGGLFTFPQAL
ncbi:FAD-binding oxidoreductase [Streptomyces sp. AJS327]|uniref:FAD-binding oxidoreductase n=1 Tax=Streptomyces sp. AJS327 TaxID=2545265 RepID=UPI002155D3B1|nr:FAD-binding oxidoreductase [Streptomyces sp. AJS327]